MKRLLAWLRYKGRLRAAYRLSEALGYEVSPPSMARLREELREPYSGSHRA